MYVQVLEYARSSITIMFVNVTNLLVCCVFCRVIQVDKTTLRHQSDFNHSMRLLQIFTENMMSDGDTNNGTYQWYTVYPYLYINIRTSYIV